MSPRKSRPVLYEILRRSQRQRPPTRRTTGQPPPPAPQVDQPAGTPAGPTVIDDTETPAPTAYARRMQMRPAPVRLSEGKLHLAIGWPSGIVIGVALICLLLVAYDAGKRSAAPDETPPGENTPAAERTAPPGDGSAHQPAQQPGGTTPPGSINGRGAAIPDNPTAEAAPTERETPSEPEPPASDELRGQYIVVQDMGVQRDRSRRMRDAVAIVEHLRSHGIGAMVYQRPGQIPLVVATQPVEELSSAQVEELKANIRAAGREFPDYDFRDCFERRF